MQLFGLAPSVGLCTHYYMSHIQTQCFVYMLLSNFKTVLTFLCYNIADQSLCSSILTHKGNADVVNRSWQHLPRTLNKLHSYHTGDALHYHMFTLLLESRNRRLCQELSFIDHSLHCMYIFIVNGTCACDFLR